MRKSKTTETKAKAKLVRCNGTRFVNNEMVQCDSTVEKDGKYNFCQSCLEDWRVRFAEFFGEELRGKKISEVAAELDEVLGDG
jgi:hypothetical protein